MLIAGGPTTSISLRLGDQALFRLLVSTYDVFGFQNVVAAGWAVALSVEEAKFGGRWCTAHSQHLPKEFVGRRPFVFRHSWSSRSLALVYHLVLAPNSSGATIGSSPASAVVPGLDRASSVCHLLGRCPSRRAKGRFLRFDPARSPCSPSQCVLSFRAAKEVGPRLPHKFNCYRKATRVKPTALPSPSCAEAVLFSSCPGAYGCMT